MIELLKDLINISSISGNEARIGHFLLKLFKDHGYQTATQPVEEDSFNVLATSGRQAKVLLCSHMDTVAPFIPFHEEHGIIYGRGACDAKGQIVADFGAIHFTIIAIAPKFCYRNLSYLSCRPAFHPCNTEIPWKTYRVLNRKGR